MISRKEAYYMNINFEISALIFNSKHGMNFNPQINFFGIVGDLINNEGQRI